MVFILDNGGMVEEETGWSGGVLTLFPCFSVLIFPLKCVCLSLIYPEVQFMVNTRINGFDESRVSVSEDIITLLPHPFPFCHLNHYIVAFCLHANQMKSELICFCFSLYIYHIF